MIVPPWVPHHKFGMSFRHPAYVSFSFRYKLAWGRSR